MKRLCQLFNAAQVDGCWKLMGPVVWATRSAPEALAVARAAACSAPGAEAERVCYKRGREAFSSRVPSTLVCDPEARAGVLVLGFNPNEFDLLWQEALRWPNLRVGAVKLGSGTGWRCRACLAEIRYSGQQFVDRLAWLLADSAGWIVFERASGAAISEHGAFPIRAGLLCLRHRQKLDRARAVAREPRKTLGGQEVEVEPGEPGWVWVKAQPRSKAELQQYCEELHGALERECTELPASIAGLQAMKRELVRRLEDAGVEVPAFHKRVRADGSAGKGV